MITYWTLLVLLSWVVTMTTGELDQLEGFTYPRQVVKLLTVNNGHAWGSWERAQFCPTGTYATGFELKVEQRVVVDVVVVT